MAQKLFAGLPRRYEFLAELLSFGQNARWRRAMLERVVPVRPALALDVAAGTGAVARRLAAQTGAPVVAIDLSEPMLRQAVLAAKSASGPPLAFVVARAEQLPFPDTCFDALTFTYLLRYVADPAATVRELARVVKPHAPMASLDFAVPERPLWRAAWWCYTRAVLPVAGLVTGGRAWFDVGRFLGPSIAGFEARHAPAQVDAAWRAAGFTEVGHRRMSLGGGIVRWGRRRVTRPAFYAARPGTWRDWWTLLHPPYTVWHLSYVAIGAALAPRLDGMRLLWTELAFFAAVGLAAHALDELRGRPLRTGIGDRALIATAAAGLAVAVALGIAGVDEIGVALVPCIVVGPLLVLGYNLELFGGRLHNTFGFAAAWGAFPVVTAYVAQRGTVGGAAVLGAVAAFAVSCAQRALSTPARRLRRRVRTVEGTMVLADGSEQVLDAAALLAPLERALQAMCFAMPALAAAMVVARL